MSKERDAIQDVRDALADLRRKPAKPEVMRSEGTRVWFEEGYLDYDYWLQDAPESRVRALVLIYGQNVPVVAQFEPKLDLWVSKEWDKPVHWHHCEWHPLPFHPSFNPKTHAVSPRRQK